MNESSPEPASRPRDDPLERLPLRTDDAVVAARWKEGLERWGHAFVAFALLRPAEFGTPDVLVAFEDCYLASYPDRDSIARAQVEALGWADQLDRFRLREGIGEELLSFDREAILRQLDIVQVLVEEGDEIHAFSRWAPLKW